VTHFKVDIQLPLRYNSEKNDSLGKKIPEASFLETYQEILKLFGGINTTNTPIMGSWKCPNTGKVYNDQNIVFTVLVESEDKATITNVPKIRELIKYKEIIKNRFKQEEIFMVATRCSWL